MSGQNTKDSKINRFLDRQIKADKVTEERYYNIEKVFLDVIEKQQKSIEELTATNTLFATTAHRLEAENARLRRYLGSVLFQRRLAVANEFCARPLDRLEPKWGSR